MTVPLVVPEQRCLGTITDRISNARWLARLQPVAQFDRRKPAGRKANLNVWIKGSQCPEWAGPDRLDPLRVGAAITCSVVIVREIYPGNSYDK